MLPSVHELAAGRWVGILSAFGLSEKTLSGKHCPCPVCGGKDRFRFDNKNGKGTFYCSGCGAGNGVDLVMKLKGWSFKEAAKEIQSMSGSVPQVKNVSRITEETKIERLKSTWAEGQPTTGNDEASRYLRGRGLNITDGFMALRIHPGLVYREGSETIGIFPTMLATITSHDGVGLSIHRTYLKDGNKAPVPQPKKVMPGRTITGGAIRLFPFDDHLGIAEGIETAIAAHELSGLPVWSCISSGGVESFIPPKGAKRISIFADNDLNFAGQKAAFAAANRLSLEGLSVTVHVPKLTGDWLDVLLARKQEKNHVA
jgi:putative DNA primase/helicase